MGILRRQLNRSHFRTAALIGITGLFASAAFTNAAAQTGPLSTDDGTYAIHPVQSVEACTALCNADELCRGSLVYQNDITKPDMVCHLNDGFGTNPAFPQEAPEALDYDQALSDLNAYRRSNGLQPLIYNQKLNRASEVHAQDIASAGILSHTGTDGSSSGDRIQRQGYYPSIAGENAASGQKSWERVFDGWKNSPGHNENLLRDDVSEFGIALAYEPTTAHSTYWVMLVAAPLDITE